MEKIRSILRKKPMVFLIGSLVYVVILSLLRWGIHPRLDTVWFIAGGVVGIYFLDMAEDFFALTPSPFRSILFMGVYIVVSFFVATSSSVALARGLVLSLYLQLLMWQVGEWKLTGSNATWYRMVAVTVPIKVQQWILVGSFLVFGIETYLFIR